MTVAVILAGGVGSRVGSDVPKQFVKVLGKPIVAYTAQLFQRNEGVDAILVVCHNAYINEMQSIVNEYALTKVRWIVDGGETFLDSLRNGINYLHGILQADDIVMIHYAAAPFTTQAMLDDSLKVCREKGNAVCAIPCYQLMGSNNGDRSDVWIDRDKMTQITCPYSFRFSFIYNLYKEADSKGIVDKVEPHTTTLMQYMGYPLYLSYGNQTNIKITTQEDLLLFEGWCLANKGVW